MIQYLYFTSSFYVIAAVSFIVLFLVRFLWIKRPLGVTLFHGGLFIVFFVLVVGGGGVQNDGYQRLERFEALEKAHKLEEAKKHPSSYDGMFAIDLEQFENVQAFRAYLKEHDRSLHRSGAMSMGWLLVLLCECARACAFFVRYCVRRIKSSSCNETLKK